MSMEIRNPALRHRAEWAKTLALTLEHCNSQEAAAICAAFLDTVETGGPRHDWLGHVYADARLWADSAPPHELVAYTLAGLDRLPRAHLGNATHKRAFVALWDAFDASDRARFLGRVDPDGKFHGGRT